MEENNIPAEPVEPKIETENKNLSINLNWVKKINLKYLGVAILVVALASVAFYYKSVLVAATVDGHIISRLAVVKELEKQNGAAALETLINNQLIQNEATKKKVAVSDADLNVQIDKIKKQVESQGMTFDDALKQANLTMSQLKTQIKNEMLLEKLLGDKVAVTDAEVDGYISGNKVTVPAGEEAATKEQIKEQLVQTKVGQNGQAFIDSLRTAAKVKTYVNY